MFDATIGAFMAFIWLQVATGAEETGPYSWSRFCTVNQWPMANNPLLSVYANMVPWTRSNKSSQAREVHLQRLLNIFEKLSSDF